jgi:hypothetical protein
LGIPVVLTTEIAKGTPLVGRFRTACQGYVKTPLRVDTYAQGEDQFRHNTVLIRAEERFLVTVRRPAALLKITGLGDLLAGWRVANDTEVNVDAPLYPGGREIDVDIPGESLTTWESAGWIVPVEPAMAGGRGIASGDCSSPAGSPMLSAPMV